MKKLIAIVLSFALVSQTAFATASANTSNTVNALSEAMTNIVAAKATEAEKQAEIAGIYASLENLSTQEKIQVVDSLLAKYHYIRYTEFDKESALQAVYAFTGWTVTAFVVLYAATKSTKAAVITVAVSALTIGTLIYRQEIKKDAVLKNASELEAALKNLRASLEVQAQMEVLN